MIMGDFCWYQLEIFGVDFHNIVLQSLNYVLKIWLSIIEKCKIIKMFRSDKWNICYMLITQVLKLWYAYILAKSYWFKWTELPTFYPFGVPLLPMSWPTKFPYVVLLKTTNNYLFYWLFQIPFLSGHQHAWYGSRV